jgi:spermidine/putrescine-binding protein
VIDIMARGDAGGCMLGWQYVQLGLEQRGFKATSTAPTKTGSITSADTYCIAAEAPNLPGSYAVLNAAISAYGNTFLSSFQESGVTNPASVQYLPKSQQTLYPYRDISTYFIKNPLFKTPPPITSGEFASVTDVNNTWTTISS